MVRRWSIPLTTALLTFGSMLGLAGNASAAVGHHATAAQLARATPHGYRPGGPMIKPAGAKTLTSGGHTTAQSTNWSGYAVTGANGAFSGVSASWTEPTA